MRKTDDSFSIEMAVLLNDIKYIKSTVKETKDRLDKDYVEKKEFDPVRNLVYGLVGLILMAVVGAMVALVVKNPI